MIFNTVNKYKLIIFDLDGTLLDTLEDLAAGINHALEKNGYKKKELSDVRTYVGNGIRNAIYLACDNNVSDDKLDILKSDFSSYYAENCMNKTRAYPGVSDHINELHDDGIYISVVTNKLEEVSIKLCNHFFGSAINPVYGDGGMFEKKPNPDAVNYVINKFGFNKDEVLFVGDSGVDFETAKNAGIDCALMSWGFWGYEKLKSLNGAVICENINDLRGIIYN